MVLQNPFLVGRAPQGLEGLESVGMHKPNTSGNSIELAKQRHHQSVAPIRSPAEPAGSIDIDLDKVRKLFTEAAI